MAKNELVDIDGKLHRKIIKVKVPYIDKTYLLLYLPKKFVPVISKNKDTLVSYIRGIRTTLKQLEDQEDMRIRVNLKIDSSRFIDITDFDGKRICELGNDKYKELLLDRVNTIHDAKEHPDNKCVKGFSFLTLSCPCGNSYNFSDTYEIPEQSFFCGLCGDLLLDYTGYDQEEFMYNKNPDIHINADEKEVTRILRRIANSLIQKGI